MSSSLVLSLGDLEELRGTIHPEHGQVWSIRDFINKTNEKDLGNAYGGVTWANLVKGEHKHEILSITRNVIIEGSQGRPTPCTNIHGLQYILTLLPGNSANKYIETIMPGNHVFTRVQAGDKTLIQFKEKTRRQPSMPSSLVLCLGDLGNLRGINHPEHGDIWSVKDFINKANKKDIGNAYGGVTWANLLKGEHEHEILSITRNVIIEGSQGRPVPCTNIHGLQYILTLLPGSTANKYRDMINHVFTRVQAGDTTLIPEIQENSMSNNPVNVLAREALKQYKERKPPARKIATKFIYATQSPAFPGAVKIGRATNVKNRLSSANTFAAPSPHKVVAVAPSLNYIRDEKEAHAHFHSAWLKGEFFKATVADVKHFFKHVIEARYHDELQNVMLDCTSDS